MRQDYQNAALQGKGSGSGKFVHNKRKMFDKNFKWTYQMDQVFLKMRCSRIKSLQMDRWKQQRNLTRHWKAFFNLWLLLESQLGWTNVTCNCPIRSSNPRNTTALHIYPVFQFSNSFSRNLP